MVRFSIMFKQSRVIRRFEVTFVTLVRLNVKMNTMYMADKYPKNLMSKSAYITHTACVLPSGDGKSLTV